MKFRNITLQEQFFPGSMQEKILMSNRPMPILNNIVDASTTSGLIQESKPTTDKRLLRHVREYWPAYLVLLLTSYVIWERYNKTREEEEIESYSTINSTNAKAT